MGQKLSDLKAAMSTMENESGSGRKTGVNKGGVPPAVLDSSVRDGASAQESVSPFDNLYGSTSVLSGAAAPSDVTGAGASWKSSSGKHCSKHCSYLRSHASKTHSTTCKKRSRSKSVQSSKEFEKSKKKGNHWVVKFHCALLKSSCRSNSASTSSSYDPHVHETSGSEACVCTGLRPNPSTTETPPSPPSSPSEPQDATASASAAGEDEACVSVTSTEAAEPASAAEPVNSDDYPIEDCDEEARAIRAREMAEGIELPANYQLIQQVCPPDLDFENLTALFQTHLGIYRRAISGIPPWDILPMITAPMLSQRVHTQIDYIHYLVPDLLEITKSPFYWGEMDRYEADRLLEGKPDGSFLLRDSAQEEYLFSISFRKYGRSLHARIEEWNHQVSFDSHDPSVYVAPTVCALIEHYNDPSCCMFFEPVLTSPIYRDYPFSLQRLCRAVVTSMATYDGINQLMLPKSLKNYLKKYHYKQRVCVRRLDNEQ